jgi:YD repeat-containing protein
MTKETTPDASYNTRTYKSDLTENSVIIQDENGSQFKLQYSQLGQLVNEWDIATGTALVRNTYNDLGQLIKETNSKGSYSNYTFDSVGRIKRVMLKEADGSVLQDEKYTYDEANSNGLYAKTTKEIVENEYFTKVTTQMYTNSAGMLVKQESMHNGSPYTDE